MQDYSSATFMDDLVKAQLRRHDICALLDQSVGTYAFGFKWKDFWVRYSNLGTSPSSPAKKGHKNRLSTSSLSCYDQNEEGQSVIRERCKSIYEMYGLVTGGGNGLIEPGKSTVFLSERAWWSLERNLAVYESKQARPVLENENTTGALDAWEIESVLDVGDEQDMSVDQLLQARAKENKKEARPVELSGQRRKWMALTRFLTWWIPTWTIVKIGKMTRPDVQQAWREKV